MKMNWMSLFVLAVLSVFISVFLSSAIVAAEEQAGIQTPNNLLEIQEAIGAVRAELTADDLSALTGGLFKTPLGTSEYHQLVRFKAEEGEETIDSGAVVFATNSNNRTGDYLFFSAGSTILEYALVFDEGITSNIIAGSAVDFVGKKLNILGSTYTIQSTTVDGEEVTISLAQDNTTLQFSDSSFADADFSNHPLVNGQEIADGKVKIEATRNNDVITINSLRYRITPSSDVYIVPDHGIKEYLSQPETLLTDNWDIQYNRLTDTGVSIVRFNSKGDNAYDLQFTNREGLEYDVPFIDNSGDTETTSPKYGDDNDDLIFVEGNINESGVGFGQSNGIGREKGDINGLFKSIQWAGNQSLPNSDVCGNWFNIDEGDYFVLTNHGGTNYGSGDELSFTHILSYESIDTSNRKITFQDDATGQQQVFYNTTNLSNTCLLGKATIIVGGNTYTIYISDGKNGAGAASSSKFPIAVDMNADSRVDVMMVDVVVNGGGILRLGGVNVTKVFNDSGGVVGNLSAETAGLAEQGWQFPFSDGESTSSGDLNETKLSQGFRDSWRNSTNISGGTAESFFRYYPVNKSTGVNFTVSITTRASEFDGPGLMSTGSIGKSADEVVFISLFGNQGNKANLLVPSPQMFQDTANKTVLGGKQNLLKMDVLNEEDLIQGLSTYGLFFEQTDESDTNDANDLTIEYPLSQRGGNVNIVMNDTLINNMCIIVFEENEYVSPCESLNLSEYSDHPVTGMTIMVEGYGMIDFGNSSLNLTDPDSGLYLNILPNNITLQSTVLNVPATLTLYDLLFINPEILVNGQSCPSNECTILNYTNGTLTFSVQHFSSYSAGEKQPAPQTSSSSSIGGSGGGGGGSRRNKQVAQQANQQVQSTTPTVSVPAPVSPSVPEQVSESPTETAITSQEESLELNQEADAGLSGVTGAVAADIPSSNKQTKVKSIVSLFIGVALLYGFFKLKERKSDQINKHNKELKKD